MSITDLPIIVPEDRSDKQRPMAFCRNPACQERADLEFTFEVKHDRCACPKCGANKSPMVGLLTLTHLLVPIAQGKGPILGKGGLTYAIACDHKRAYLATMTNNEAATDQVKFANCPGCLEIAEKLGIKKPTGQVFTTQ